MNNNRIDSICVYIFCKDETNKACVLAGKRSSKVHTGQNLFNPPMGMVDEGENPLDAAVRECLEESGVHINKNHIKIFDKTSYPMMGRMNTGLNLYVLLSGTTSNYPIGQGDGENHRFQWLPITQVSTLKWAFGTDEKMREIITHIRTTIRKSNKRQLKPSINESYNGPLYHFTNLANLYSIVKGDKMLPSYGTDNQGSNTHDGVNINRKKANRKFICFTRDKNYNIKQDLGEVICKLTFNADELVNIRNARLYPVNWPYYSNKNIASKYNFSIGREEAEERLFVDILEPFSKYVKRIDIYTENIDDDDTIEYYMEPDFFDEVEELYGDTETRTVNIHIINEIISTPNLRGKVFIDGQQATTTIELNNNYNINEDNNMAKVQLNESTLRKLIEQSIKEYFYFDMKNKDNKGYKNRKDWEEEDARKALKDRQKRNEYPKDNKDVSYGE